MRQIFFAFIMLAFVCSSSKIFAQDNPKNEILTEINLKTYYFQHLQGGVTINEEGLLTLNGVKMDIKNSEIGYQYSDEGDSFIYFLTVDGTESYEAWNSGELLFKTNNVLHIMNSDDQAMEMVVLFNLLKSLYAS
ncbi:hypothetical protein [Chondrinema litorale]|uniref:hypothetical protein n=1 Tax=Chondrinema litorale TaxID=2994555 RepID=UPI002543BCAE|nr:hypothetical protein [Chondrinema litorale]UZR94969.1 hypothetical protein OQ292_03965 [Chondrinema litorale]